MSDPVLAEQLELRHLQSIQDGNSKGILSLWSKEQVLIPGQGASKAVTLKRDMPLQLNVKDDMDWLALLGEDLEPAPEDLNPATSGASYARRKVHVLGIDMVEEDESGMPQHLQLPGVHSTNVDPEENDELEN